MVSCLDFDIMFTSRNKTFTKWGLETLIPLKPQYILQKLTLELLSYRLVSKSIYDYVHFYNVTQHI